MRARCRRRISAPRGVTQITGVINLTSSRTCYSDRVGIELIVEPAASGSGNSLQKRTTAMLWTIGEDPQVLDAQAFSNPADLRTWLKRTAERYGPGSIVVRWSRQLQASPHMAKLVAVCLGVELPQELQQRAVMIRR